MRMKIPTTAATIKLFFIFNETEPRYENKHAAAVAGNGSSSSISSNSIVSLDALQMAGLVFVACATAGIVGIGVVRCGVSSRTGDESVDCFKHMLNVMYKQ